MRERVQRFRAGEGVAQRKLRQLDIATELRDLASPPGNRLEALKSDREGQHSNGHGQKNRGVGCSELLEAPFIEDQVRGRSITEVTPPGTQVTFQFCAQLDEDPA